MMDQQWVWYWGVFLFEFLEIKTCHLLLNRILCMQSWKSLYSLKEQRKHENFQLSSPWVFLHHDRDSSVSHWAYSL